MRRRALSRRGERAPRSPCDSTPAPPVLLPDISATAVLFALLAAMVLDAIIGDPAVLYRRIPHPVAVAGRLIEWLERQLNRGARRRLKGVAALCVVAGVAGLLGFALQRVFAALPGGIVLEILTVAVLLAQRGLYVHVRAVARAAADGLAPAREAAARIVGRDLASADEAAVARAAVESCAENFSDGVIAPAFWYLILGLPGICVYKAVNTADSMVGYRNARYRAFGWASAKTDDLLNYVPARISAILLCIGAMLLPGTTAVGAARCIRADARHSSSPNAGWPEAAFAGALGFSLAGPRCYAGHQMDGAWIGNGRQDLDGNDVDRALRLFVATDAVLIVLLAVTASVVATG